MTKVYLKYRHLPSLQDSISPGVKDPQNLGHEEVERVKRWLQDHMTELKEGSESERISVRNCPMILVEAGVTDVEASFYTMLGHVLLIEFHCFCENLFHVCASCSNMTPLPS